MKQLKMRENLNPGMLITFCGLDGCGKTTMINRLAKEMDNVFLTKQPTNAVRNSDIFRTFMDCPDYGAYEYRSLSLLAASDRVQHVSKVIEPKLAGGCNVISDRYFYSCIANLNARGFENDQWIYEIAESMIKPDIAFFFDVPVDVAVSRVRSRPEESARFIDMELQYRLRKQYIELCELNGGILVSTEGSLNETFSRVISEVNRVQERRNKYGR